MLRISKLTDYAFILLNQMAKNSAAVYAASELANGTGIAIPTVSKVLKSLAKANIVRSARGAKGGYSLVGAPEHMTVAAVIDALEGPIALTDCADASGRCEQAEACGVRTHWPLLNRAVYTALSGVTLADMLTPSRTAEEVSIPVQRITRTSRSLPGTKPHVQ